MKAHYAYMGNCLTENTVGGEVATLMVVSFKSLNGKGMLF
jgi:hypothetical protein